MDAGGEAGRPRLDWLDALKGAAILLVVFGHIWRGLLSSGVLTDGVLFQTVDRLIYNFHMPLFFMIAGALLPASMAKRSFVETVQDRTLRLLWPLALWTWAMATVKIAAGGLANAPVPLSEFPLFPLPPFEQFWFLWALFLIQIVLAAFSPLLRLRWGWPIALAGAVALYFLAPGMERWPEWLFAAYRHAPFLVAGAVIGVATQRPGRAGALLFVFAVAEGLAVFLDPTPAVALILPMAAASSLFVAAAAIPAGWSAAQAMRALIFLGHASMAIYVAHVIFQAAARIALLKMGVAALAPHLVIGLAAGVLGPIALYLIARRLGLMRLAGF